MKVDVVVEDGGGSFDVTLFTTTVSMGFHFNRNWYGPLFTTIIGTALYDQIQ